MEWDVIYLIDERKYPVFGDFAIFDINIFIFFLHSLFITVLTMDEERNKKDKVEPWDQRRNSTRQSPSKRNQNVTKVIRMSQASPPTWEQKALIRGGSHFFLPNHGIGSHSFEQIFLIVCFPKDGVSQQKYQHYHNHLPDLQFKGLDQIVCMKTVEKWVEDMITPTQSKPEMFCDDIPSGAYFVFNPQIINGIPPSENKV